MNSKISMEKVKNYSIVFWSLGLIAIGFLHLIKPDFFLHVMPPYFPFPKILVALSGVVEIIFGICFWQKKLHYAIAIGIILMLVVYLPVHIYMITDNDILNKLEPSISLFVAWVRLPLQFVFIAWIWIIRK